jgi:hypothetical protein
MKDDANKMPKVKEKTRAESWGNFGQTQNKESGWKKFEHIAFPISNLHKGTRSVKKTGPYILKKGEAVLTVKQQKSAGLKKGSIKKTSARKRVASKA